MSGDKRTHIIGIGSPSGDDQVGWLVVEALADRLPPEVEITKMDRPGSALIPLLEKADRVVLIDAMQGNGTPGNIHRFANGDWVNYRTGMSSHGLGVFDALQMARELGALPARLELYGIQIGAALPGRGPADAVIAAARELADRIAAKWGA